MSNSNQIFRSQAGRRQRIAGNNQPPVLRPRFLIGLLLCACGFLLPACRNAQAPPASNTGSTETRKVTFTTPPFSTKEPGRYQAVRITTIIETGTSESSSSSQSNQVLIARDGEKRREEYSAGASGQIVHLEIPAGRFLVLPAGRIYAELRSASDETDHGKRPIDSPDDYPQLSPDQLLNEAQAPATYEKLGAETVVGRMTTKYRVVVSRAESQNETLIWIDDALGIPVKSETVSKSTGRSSNVRMELKDVKLEVDERLFSWPTDYRKVEAQTIFDLIRKGQPAAPK